MLDNASDDVKRYAPPQLRNRAANSRRSGGERSERSSYSHGNSRIITLEGCCTSDAAHLLKERWLAALRSCDDPSVDISERPVMYSGEGGLPWGHLKLAHQMDFLTELRREMHKANIGTHNAI